MRFRLFFHKNRLLVFFGLFLAVFFFPCGISAEEVTVSGGDISVSFDYGFEHSCKIDRKFPVTANITNNGGDFSGALGVIYLPYEDNQPVLYEVPCVIASGETKQIEFTAPASSGNRPIFILKNDEEEILLQKSFRLSLTTAEDTVFAGILTDQESSLDYIRSLDLAKLFSFDADSLPSTTDGLDSLDMLIINNYNTEQLSGEQREAILSWAGKGGTLIFGTGANAARTLSAFEKSVFNGTIGEARHSVLPAASAGNNASPMKTDLVSLRFSGFTPILSNEDGCDLLLKMPYENGVILAASFDLGLKNSYKSSVGTWLFKNFQDQFSQTAKKRLSNDHYYSYSLSQALHDGKTDYPHLNTYLILLAAYAVITGPILYLILKKLDKRHLLWVFMPISCLICTAVMYAVGSSSRITEPYIRFFSLASLDQADGSAEETQEVYFNITSPYNKKYSVTLENVSDIKVRNPEGYYYPYADPDDNNTSSAYYKTAIYQNGNSSTLIMNDYAAFNAAAFYCRSKESSRITGTFDADMTLQKDFSVSGTLTNHLGISLKQAVYITNGQLYILGPMKDGDSVSLDNCESAILNSGNSLYSSISNGNDLLSALSEDPKRDIFEQQQIFSCYEYYLSAKTSLYTDSGHVVAITEDAEAGFLNDTGLSTSGFKLLDINIEPAYGAAIELLDRSLISTDDNENFYYPSDRYVYGELTLNFQIDHPETVKSLVYPETGNEEFTADSGNYNNFFQGTLSAYNFSTDQYEPLFISGTSGSCDDISPYLSKEGTLTLLCEADQQQPDKPCSFPMLYLVRGE